VWRTNLNNEYFFAQHGSCLFSLGRSAAEGDLPPGTFFTNVFEGRIESDFTVAGLWGDVPAEPNGSLNHGTVRLAIEFFSDSGQTLPSLHLLEDDPDIYGDSRWQPELSVGELATYVGILGIDPGPCPWLEIEGARYELTGWVSVEGSHVSGASGQSIGVGELARVEGRIAQALGYFGCQSSALLVMDIVLER
jgi:hypothetical protein